MAAETRQKRLFKNSIYSLMSWLFPIVPTFIVTPIVVRGLGNEIFGIYTLIIGFISYFFTFGIGKAAAKYVAEYRATGETGKISDIISSTVLLSLMLGVIGTGSIALLARIIVTDVLLVSAPLQETAVIALYLACANILLAMIYQIFQLVLQGLHRFDRYLLLMNLNSLSMSIGSVILVLNGFGVTALLIWTLIVAGSIAILSVWMAKRLLPEFKFSLKVSGESWSLVWHYAASIIAYQVFGNLLLLFERGWIMRRFGAEALTFYAVPMTLGMYIHLFTSSLIVAIFPMVNELLTQREKLVTLYQKSTKLVVMLVAFAVVSAIAGGRIFLGVWMNADFARISYVLLVLHVFTFGLLAMNTIVWQVAEGFRKASLNALATFAWMAISIPLMIVLSDHFASVGVALGRLTGVFVFVPLIFFVEKRFLGGIFWSFWAGVLVRVLIAAVAAAVAEELTLYLLKDGWAAFFISVVIGLAAYATALLVCGFFDSEDRQMFRDAFARAR
jgi:O-antigen/teichoic acid export membrane protein